MKIKTLTLFLVLLSFCAMSQKDERNANYHYKSENYHVAVELYAEVYKQDTNNEINIYRYADCLIKCKQQPELAVDLLQRIVNENTKDPQYFYLLGKAYHYNYEFAKAISQYQQSVNLAGKDEELKQKASLWIEYAQSAQQMVKKPLDISFVNLGKYINSKMEETTPFTSKEGDMLFYTSNQKYDREFLLYTSNVYFSTQKNGVFEKGKALTAVNSMDDEFMAGISRFDDKLYVQLQGYEAFEDIIVSERVGRGYRGKTLLNDNVNSKSSEFAAFETENGDTLFFSSNRPEGYGGTDIYYSLRLPDGRWSIPRNLGNNVNTPYDEDFPVVSSDGSTLYFCSNNPNSMGGFDIFESRIFPETREFSKPKNIGFPLNDVYENKTIAFSYDDRYAYVSTIKDDGFGNTDLYRVIFNQEDPAVKIYILNFKKGNKDAKEDFATSDTTLKIEAFKKGKIVFGEYAYDATNSQATMALPPGFYSIKISGIRTEENLFKVTIPDMPTDDKIVKKEIILQLKN